jgi:nitrite reductase/ring-hydroxylating ferredoxin subunit
MTPEWHRACDASAVAQGMQAVQIAHRKLVVARVDDALYAFAGFCPHVAGPMHRGELNGCIVTCPLHGWRFDLSRGGCEIHGERPIETYPVKEEDGAIYVRL